MRWLKDPVAWYRASRWLYLRGWTRVSWLVDLAVRQWFGCFVPGSASLGAGVVLGYGGLGVVIHKDAVVGDDVLISPGVLIGGNGVEIGVPAIGAKCKIGAGAKVLGPVRLGPGAIIGANAVVVTDIPDGCVAVGVPARTVKAKMSPGAH